jgi:UDP-N-acetylglucosamine transferase subunit ALG13
MIVVSLGTIPYPFNRALAWVKALIEKGSIAESVFIQYGTSDISSLLEYPLVTADAILDSKELTRLIDKARLVISHAGQGSTRLLAARGCSFILLPRLKIHGEHVDDHQLGFAQAVEAFGVQHCLSLEQLEQAVLNPPSPFQRTLFSEPKLSQHLIETYGGRS